MWETIERENKKALVTIGKCELDQSGPVHRSKWYYSDIHPHAAGIDFIDYIIILK